MATYILVPGMWLGAWAWQEVAAPLRAAGHSVYPLTLTGLADKIHLGGPQVNLDTHVADVLNLMRYEQLDDVILVGHSYAANVIYPAADQAPERIARLVFVDTWPLPDGMAQADLLPPEMLQQQEQQVAELGQGWGIPLPPWEALDQGNELRGLGEAERRKFRERASHHPVGSIMQPVRLANPQREALPKTAIWTSMSLEEVQGLIEAYPQPSRELTLPGWQTLELPTGHWPMFSCPRELADMLLGLAG